MSRLPFLAAVLGCALVAAASYSPRADFAAAEQARIRAHLDSVERELRAKDVSTLTPTQRAARLRNLAILHVYWIRGVFPQNTDFPGQRVPYFIDRYGKEAARHAPPLRQPRTRPRQRARIRSGRGTLPPEPGTPGQHR